MAHVLSSPHLRLFAADDPPAETRLPRRERPAGLTLRDVWEQFKLPELAQEGRAAETLSDYVRHLGRWEQFWGSAGAEKYRIADPVLLEINRQQLLAWRAWLMSDLGIGPRSANKHLGTVHALLACAELHGHLQAGPRLKPLEHTPNAPKLYLAYDEIDALYEACEVADWPRRTGRGGPLPWSPRRYWQCLLVLLFNYGCRTQELVAYQGDARPLYWRQVHWHPDSPAVDGRATCEFGWLAYVPTKQRRKKPEPLVLPLNQTVQQHLRSIEPLDGADPERPVFDWPLCGDRFYGTWERIVAAAGIAPKPDPVTGTARKYQLLHFRKTCTTWLNHHRRGIAPHITGHARRGRGDDDAVVTKFYDNVEQAVLEALLTFPQPSSFARIDGGGERQRMLF